MLGEFKVFKGQSMVFYQIYMYLLWQMLLLLFVDMKWSVVQGKKGREREKERRENQNVICIILYKGFRINEEFKIRQLRNVDLYGRLRM